MKIERKIKSELKKPIFILTPSIEWMKEILEVLNFERRSERVRGLKEENRLLGWDSKSFLVESRRLQTLVQLWMDSGPNLARLLKENPKLHSQIERGTTSIIPTDTGRAHLIWHPAPSGEAEGGLFEKLALLWFSCLIVNPSWNMLGGPCERCKLYYLKKRNRQKIYCSQKCASGKTAQDRTRERRQQEHADKLKKAIKVLDEWNKGSKRGDWKTHVIGKTGVSTGITKSWLTRAMNKGELNPSPEIG